MRLNNILDKEKSPDRKEQANQGYIRRGSSSSNEGSDRTPIIKYKFMRSNPDYSR